MLASKTAKTRQPLVLFLFFALLLSVTAHVDHADNEYSEVEHYQCQLCQGNIDIPSVELATTQTKTFEYFQTIERLQHAAFVTKLQMRPPLRAPPIS